MLGIKRRPAWWIAGAATILAVLYMATYADLTFIVANRVAAVTTASFVLLFSCTTASLSCAIEAGRERESRGVFENSRRAFLAQMWGRMWPGIGAGVLIQVVGAVTLVVLAGPSDRGVPWFLLIGQVLAVIVHATLGYALGVWLRPVWAIPLAVLLPYVWIGATWSVDFFGIRYLAGLAFEGCCTPTSVLDPKAVAGFIVFSLLATVAGLLAINSHRYAAQHNRQQVWKRAGGAVLVLTVALVSGLTLTAATGPNPDRPRPTSELQCQGSDPQVCFFPGQFMRNDTREIYAHVFRVANQAGLPRVVRVESTADPAPLRTGTNGEWSANVIAQPTYSAQDSALAAASTYATQVMNTDCSDDSVHAQMSVVTAWLWLKGVEASGVSADTRDAEPLVDPSAQSSFHQLLKSDDTAAHTWIARTYTSAMQCSRPQPFTS